MADHKTELTLAQFVCMAAFFDVNTDTLLELNKYFIKDAKHEHLYDHAPYLSLLHVLQLALKSFSWHLFEPYSSYFLSSQQIYKLVC